MHTEMLGQKHGVWHRPTPKTQGWERVRIDAFGILVRMSPAHGFLAGALPAQGFATTTSKQHTSSRIVLD